MDQTLKIFLEQYSYLFALLMFWTIPWKGVALWKAARLGQKIWFVALLVVNTVGLLEIFYIFAIARRKEKASHIQNQ